MDLTVADVAARMSLTPDTVAARLRDQTIPGGYQLSPRGRWRVRRGEFEAWHATLTGQYAPTSRLEPPSNASRRRIARRGAR